MMSNMAECLAHSKFTFIICVEYYPGYYDYIHASIKYQGPWIVNKSMGYSLFIYTIEGLTKWFVTFCDSFNQERILFY